MELGGVELKYFRVKGQIHFVQKIMNVEFFASILARIRVTGFKLWQPFLPTFNLNSAFPPFIINEIRGALLHLVQILLSVSQPVISNCQIFTCLVFDCSARLCV